MFGLLSEFSIAIIHLIVQSLMNAHGFAELLPFIIFLINLRENQLFTFSDSLLVARVLLTTISEKWIQLRTLARVERFAVQGLYDIGDFPVLGSPLV